jgi:hypothetical protein
MSSRSMQSVVEGPSLPWPPTVRKSESEAPRDAGGAELVSGSRRGQWQPGNTLRETVARERPQTVGQEPSQTVTNGQSRSLGRLAPSKASAFPFPLRDGSKNGIITFPLGNQAIQ